MSDIVPIVFYGDSNGDYLCFPCAVKQSLTGTEIIAKAAGDLYERMSSPKCSDCGKYLK